MSAERNAVGQWIAGVEKRNADISKLTDYRDDIEETHDPIGDESGPNWPLYLLAASVGAVAFLGGSVVAIWHRWAP